MRAVVSLVGGFVVTVGVAWFGAAFSAKPGQGGSTFVPTPMNATEAAERFRTVFEAPSGHEYEFESNGLAARERLVTRQRVFASLVRLKPREADDAATAPAARPFAEGLGAGPTPVRPDRINLGEMSVPVIPEFGQVWIGRRAADRFQAGWPLRALEWTDPEWLRERYWSQRGPLQSRRAYQQRSAMDDAWDFGLGYSGRRTQASQMSTGWRGLPIRPTGHGGALAANTLLFAAIGWGVVWGRGTVTRWWRRRRGLCEGCGYPLRDDAGRAHERCPECGMGHGGVR